VTTNPTTTPASNYDWALPKIARICKNIGSIAEIGSRDALDAISLARRFDASVCVFEPDPINAAACRKNIAELGSDLNLTFFELALTDKSGEIEFLSIDQKLYSNRGASSIFPINFKNRSFWDRDRNRSVVQKSIKVKAVRFDEMGVSSPDLIAMDVQGAELMVLRGFGRQLLDVKAIVLETMFSENYIGGSTFTDIHQFLSSSNFMFSGSDRSDSEELPTQGFFSRFRRKYEPDFNCVYINGRAIER